MTYRNGHPYEIINPKNGDRAEADDISGVMAAVRGLVADAGPWYSTRLIRDGLIVMRDGRYDGVATALARGYI